MQNGSFRYDGLSVWSSYVYGFEGLEKLLPSMAQDGRISTNSMLIFHVRYRNQEQVPVVNGNNTFYKEDSFLSGARLHIGSPKFNVGFEGSYVRTWPDRLKQDGYTKAALIAETKIVDGFWFNLTVGKDMGNRNSKDALMVLGAVSFGHSSQPTINNK